MTQKEATREQASQLLAPTDRQERSDAAIGSRWRRFAFWAGLLFIVLVAVLCLQSWQNDWDLQAAAWTGSAAAPIVGYFSLLAVGAALYSVHLQSEALSLQARDARAQDRHRAQTLLRESYAPFLAAADSYLDAVNDYAQLLRRQPDADLKRRKEWQGSINKSHREMRRASKVAQLADGDDERRRLRWALVRSLRLEPFIDTASEQAKYCKVIEYQATAKSQAIGNLLDSLYRELGVPTAARANSTLDEVMVRAKAEADEVLQAEGERIAENLSNALKSLIDWDKLANVYEELNAPRKLVERIRQGDVPAKQLEVARLDDAQWRVGVKGEWSVTTAGRYGGQIVAIMQRPYTLMTTS